MKKLVLTIVCAVCALLVSAPLYADEGKCGDNITYRFDEATGTLTISGQGKMWDFADEIRSRTQQKTLAPWMPYKESVIEVVVEKGVTSIGSYAFYKCENLVSVTMPEGLTDIEDDAFYGCLKMISIKIPSTVEQIIGGFVHCESLQSLVVPISLKKWASGFVSPFYGCSSLTSITWNAKNMKYFDGFNSISDQITSFKFGSSVKCIPAKICKKMRRLKSITIPKSVEEIGDYAFDECDRLATVTCYAPEPPLLGYGNFEYNYPTVFNVPGNSVDEYKKVIWWRTVKAIQK